MKEIIESAKEFKIVPNNFKSSGELAILDVNAASARAKLILSDTAALKDYTRNSQVEIFGVNDLGLIYFETKIIDIKDDIIIFELVDDYSIIQRREYSRVNLDKGRVLFKDLPDNTVVNIEDISAGGMKFLTRQNLEIGKDYDIEINLTNNMKINCSLQPIRITKQDKDRKIVSGKFLNLENMDRIVLVQYAFKVSMESQNKENS